MQRLSFYGLNEGQGATYESSKILYARSLGVAHGQAADHTAAATGDNLDDQKGKNELAVLLVGPGVVGVHGVVGGPVGWLIGEGAHPSTVAETDQKGDDDDDEVGEADEGGGPGSNESEDWLVSTNSDADHVKNDDEEQDPVEQ